MICDLSTGCEIIPTSLSFVSEVAEVGVSWNNATDMRKFCFLLPKLTAEHILLNGSLSFYSLFRLCLFLILIFYLGFCFFVALRSTVALKHHFLKYVELHFFFNFS